MPTFRSICCIVIHSFDMSIIQNFSTDQILFHTLTIVAYVGRVNSLSLTLLINQNFFWIYFLTHYIDVR